MSTYNKKIFAFCQTDYSYFFVILKIIVLDPQNVHRIGVYLSNLLTS